MHRLALSIVFAFTANLADAGERTAFVVPIAKESGWQDFAFLAAVPAASAIGADRPVVLAVDADGALDLAERDFLRRWNPAREVWIAPESIALDGGNSERIVADDADSAACAIAARCFASPCSRAVVAGESDYAGALIASALAARLHAPLFFANEGGLSTRARDSISKLGAKALVVVGAGLERVNLSLGDAQVERLRDSSDVARWMHRHSLAVDELVLAAPLDRERGFVRKLSLAAAALAAGRNGIVAPIELANSADVKSAIAAWRASSGLAPEFLCIAALPEAIPMAVIPSGEGVDTDPPSDLDYGNVDADPFIELSVGRFVAESGASGTLLAARSLVYRELFAPDAKCAFAVAEWERECEPVFANLGFSGPVVHEGGKPFEAFSPVAEAAVLVHASHASWLQIGDTYVADSKVLLAPCVVETSGCSPASLDQDDAHRSVALRLLANGAVAFVGNVRRAVAQQELYRSEFWNAALAGEALGRANRIAQNRMIAAMLDRGESEHGLYRYELRAEAFFGDPALALHLPSKPKVAAAETIVKGRDVTVRAPSTWWVSDVTPVVDWGYTESKEIHTLRGAGVGVECSWDAEHHRNRDELVFTVEARTNLHVKKVELVGPPPAAPLGWDGKWFVDEHGDGTRSVFWRVKLVDFEMPSAKILAKLDRLNFRLE